MKHTLKIFPSVVNQLVYLENNLMNVNIMALLIMVVIA